MIPENIQIVSGLSRIIFTTTIGVGVNTAEYNFANMANPNDQNAPAAQAVPIPGYTGQQIVAAFWSPFDNINSLTSFRLIDVEQSGTLGQLALTAWGYPGSQAEIRIKITVVQEATFTS